MQLQQSSPSQDTLKGKKTKDFTLTLANHYEEYEESDQDEFERDEKEMGDSPEYD